MTPTAVTTQMIPVRTARRRAAAASAARVSADVAGASAIGVVGPGSVVDISRPTRR